MQILSPTHKIDSAHMRQNVHTKKSKRIDEKVSHAFMEAEIL